MPFPHRKCVCTCMYACMYAHVHLSTMKLIGTGFVLLIAPDNFGFEKVTNS